MATSLTSGKLTVNSLTLMDWKRVTISLNSDGIAVCYLPSGGNWIVPVISSSGSEERIIGLDTKSGGSAFSAANSSEVNTVSYAIRFS